MLRGDSHVPIDDIDAFPHTISLQETHKMAADAGNVLILRVPANKILVLRHCMWYHKQKGGVILSQWEKLLERIRNNPKTVTFEEVAKILCKLGYEQRQPGGGSSHYTFRKPGKPPLTIPRKSPYVKEEYVKLVIAAIDED